MQDLVDELSQEMSDALDFMEENSKNRENSENCENRDIEEIPELIDLFVNPTGINDGAAQYGIFLNRFGTSVFMYKITECDSEAHCTCSPNAIIENVKIHGLREK